MMILSAMLGNTGQTVCDATANLYQSWSCCGDSNAATHCVAKNVDMEYSTAIQAVEVMSNSLFLGTTEDGAARNIAAKRAAALSTVAISIGSTKSNQGEYYDNTTITREGNTYYPWLFSKTLPHDNYTGMALKADVDALMQLLNQDPSKLTVAEVDLVKAGMMNGRKLELPFGGRGENLIGASPRHTHIAPKSITSPEIRFDMLETYAMSVLRDVPFSDWDTNTQLADFIAAFNAIAENTAPKNAGQIDVSTVFRGKGVDELIGGFVSQFMLQPFTYGNLNIEQKFASEPDSAVTVTNAGWLAMQNGDPGMAAVKTDPKFAYSMRVLGAEVHNDPLYQFYYNAALISLGCGVGTRSGGSARISSWTDNGGPMLLWALAAVSRGTLQTAWWHKWNAHMRVRPEVLAQRFDLCEHDTVLCDAMGLTSSFDAIPPNIRTIINDHNNAALTTAGITADDGGVGSQNLYLLGQYPEGSPTHPAWPAGHATVSGACVTVLKALLNVLDETNNYARKPWPSMQCPLQKVDAMGDSLMNDDSTMGVTIVGELNKLASNAALGRNMAGVHFRSDGDEGIALGEQHAISFLQQILNEVSLRAQYDHFVLSKFDGSLIRITADAITDIMP